MSQRTTLANVQAVLADNWDDSTSVQPYIDSATVVVDRVVTCATKRGKTLTATEEELVERWLAAHFYCVMDPLYTTRSTAGASGGFQRKPATDDFGSTDYGMQATRIDPSGCLNAIGKRAVASMTWLGKPPSAQTAYEDRD